MNFICVVKDPAIILWTLIQKGFNCVNPEFASEVTALGAEGKLSDKYPYLFIAKIHKDYAIFKDKHTAERWLASKGIDSYQRYWTVDDVLKALGVNKTEAEQRQEAINIINGKTKNMDKKEFSSIANLMSSLLGGDFEKMLKEIKEELEKEDKKNNSEEESLEEKSGTFKDAIIPGYIVKFAIDDLDYGVILANRMIVCFGNDGRVKGYLKKFTQDTPRPIAGIYKPTEEAYGFSKTDKMIPVWVAPTQEVVYTMEDIEKKLGLEPGSLKIK